MPNRHPFPFRFKASAVAADGHITHPYKEVIEAHTASALSPIGGVGSARAADFRYRDILKFSLGHTQVNGTHNCCDDEDKEHPTAETKVTATIEGLNIMDMITADRIVASEFSTVSTDPGQEPIVKLVGTRFENLKIAGVKVKVNLAVDTLDNYASHKDLRDAWKKPDVGAVLTRSKEDAPPEVAHWFKPAGPDPTAMPETDGVTHASLIHSLEPESKSLQCYGHVIHVPGFGTVRLGEVAISKHTRSTTMMQLHLDCPTKGAMSMCAVADGTDPSSP